MAESKLTKVTVTVSMPIEWQIAMIIDPTIDERSLRNFNAECACALCQQDARALDKATAILALFPALKQGGSEQ